MKRVLLAMMLICFIGVSSGQLVSEDELARRSIKKVAIVETVDKVGNIDDYVKTLLQVSLSMAVTRVPGYEAYDRVDLGAILDEQNFQQTGMVSDDQIKQLGEMTGCDYVMLTEAVLGSGRILVTAKILDVRTARIENTAYVQSGLTTEEFEKNCWELAKRLLGRVRTSSGESRNPVSTSGNDYVENVVGLNMKMVYVEGGTFQMGGTSEQGGDAENDEYPVRNVRVNSYYIGACEVTQAQWQKVMGTSIHQQASKAGQSSTRGVGADYPMYYVSWEEAQAFCQELSRMTGKTYVLPTEAQWEYAARGGNKKEGTKYSGSWSVDAVAWYDGNSGGSTHPVGSKRANALGIHDMSGNVWEWCSDWYGNSYQSHETENPTGPSGGSSRVGRGGGWGSYARNCRVSYRNGSTPGRRISFLGFRVVCLP